MYVHVQQSSRKKIISLWSWFVLCLSLALKDSDLFLFEISVKIDVFLSLFLLKNELKLRLNTKIRDFYLNTSKTHLRITRIWQSFLPHLTRAHTPTQAKEQNFLSKEENIKKETTTKNMLVKLYINILYERTDAAHTLLEVFRQAKQRRKKKKKKQNKRKEINV